MVSNTTAHIFYFISTAYSYVFIFTCKTESDTVKKLYTCILQHIPPKWK